MQFSIKIVVILLLISVPVFSQTNEENTVPKSLKIPPKAVAFELVHNAPQHPDCSDTAKDPQGRRCLTQALLKKINSEFNTRLLSGTENGQRRIIITILIDEKGEIGFTSTNAEDEVFDKEIKRIIALLPTLTPGSHMRKPTRVRLRLPMTFVVSD